MIETIDTIKKSKKFKLVLGLGNNSIEQISKLCGVYAIAGADIFDLSPNVASINAAKEGILAAGLNPADFKFCISLGLKGDKHIRKAVVKNNKCKKCLKCVDRCNQGAISEENGFPKIDWAKCIGCGRCKKPCIEFFEMKTDIKRVAKEFKHERIDMVELHISSNDKKDIIKNWKFILKNFKCLKSICIDRSQYGDRELLELIKKLVKMNNDKTIIQADGVAMSGSADISSTLQAIAHAQLYKDVDADLFISGGTNHYTKKIAEGMDVRFEGVTMGSFARNALKEAIENCDTSKAIEIAKGIVSSIKD